MPGAPDPLYVAARRVLLDALTALHDHLGAIVLVGAQAVYIHTGEGDLEVAPFTTDADLAIDPRRLGRTPLIELALDVANFARPGIDVAIWHTSTEVSGVLQTIAVDLLVPESLGGEGRRGARIPPHAERTARKVSGLEAALVDRNKTTIRALEPTDPREIELSVAGPSALLVAKVHKILDRADRPDRSVDKDALDVYRILRQVPTKDLVRRFRTLIDDDMAGASTEHAMSEFPKLFSSPTTRGCRMAARAASPIEPDETVAASIAILTQDLLAGLQYG
jgi:hypothetical protein